MLLLKLACRELYQNHRFSILFILSIALGFSGYFTLQALKQGIIQQIETSSRIFLSGDISISSQRPIPTEEKEKLLNALGPYQGHSTVIEFPAMAARRGESRLVHAKVIDNSFPLYGTIHLSEKGEVGKEEVRSLNERMTAWVDPEVLTQLKLKIGDSIRIGNYSFEITDVVLDGKINAWHSNQFVPKVYLGKDQVDKLNMLSHKVTLAFYDELFLLPKGTTPEIIAEKVKNARTQAGITIHTPSSASLQGLSFLQFITDFLGLASLVSLLLAAIGAAYLLRSFIISHYVQIAILLCLGMTIRNARKLYIIQAILLASLSVFPSALLACAFFPLLSSAVAAFTPFKIELLIPFSTFFEVFLLTIIGSICITIPAIESIRQLKPIVLFHETVRMESGQGRFSFWTLAPFAFFMWGLSVWESHSIENGSLFIGGILIALVILCWLGSKTFKFFEKISHSCGLVAKLVMRSMSRNKLSSLSTFVGLSLACMLMNLITQTQLSLDTYIGYEKEEELPSLFLFDIDESSLPEVKKLLATLNLKLENLTPSIVAQLIKKNGEKYLFDTKNYLFQTREEEQRALIRNRQLTLTYRPEIAPNEKITKGRPYLKDLPEGDEIAEISIEDHFAKRLGFDLGDILEFDIQGVPIKGKIVNLRKVRWSSFKPNFFIQFQSGVLDKAPKMYLATINVPVGTDRSQIQNQIVEAIPDITIVDVHQSLQRIEEMIDHMIWAMKLMAWTALVTGLFIIYAISKYQVTLRDWENSLMKVLGAPWHLLLKTVAYEFGILSIMASIAGALMSYLLGMLLAHFMFESIWSFSFLSVLKSSAIVVSLCVLCGALATFKSLRNPTITILNQT